ncbi:ATP-dependent nuclease [Rhodococcus erythropolis]|uniref:ATP-dependent nuclease n=1 Tax=Rhodococcus erythropolis TaxID=1833 RepID=UPI001BEA4151|nr:AAA family ATPase [Rhodococcus erythropolis]MBT2269834.1 ATP-binding protein [Rhodococcus erythropolis]
MALSAARRQRFGVRRIDASTHHLKWVPNSALHQLSEKPDGKSADTVLREVSRTARTAAKAGLTPFDTSIKSITEQARLLRAASDSSSFSAELDADLTALTRGSISLHMDDLPVGRVGLGSRRLVTIGVQSLAQSGAHILLIDELESGLEPHRTRHLIRYLQRADDRQIILTTHSPSVVRELSYNQLKIARRTPGLVTIDGSSDGGTVTLITPPEEAQGTIRTHADGLLAPRVLVCEGATEVGFIRGLCNRLEEVNPARMSLIATVSADTDSQVVPTAKVFAKLGYEVAIFCDADNPDRKLAKDIAALNGTSIELLQCDPGKAIEHQTLGALTAEGIQYSIRYAIEAVGRDVVLDSLHKAGISPEAKKALAKQEPVEAPEQYLDQVIIAAGTGKWFKSVGRGQELAEIVLDPQLTTMTEELKTFLDKLRDWCAPV